MSQQPQFNHRREFNSNEKSELKSELCECDHADDIIFTFGLPLSSAKMTFDVKFTDEEKKTSLQWMNYVANFATTG